MQTSTIRLLILLSLAATLPALAQPVYVPYAPKGWKLPESEAQKWAERLKEFVPPKGWTVSTNANDVIIQREKPVGFSSIEFNPPPTRKSPPPRISKGIYHLTLRFGPKLTVDEYEKLTAQNRATDDEDRLILRKHGLTRRFDQILSYGHTAERNERIAAYKEDAKKLVLNGVPDFYTPDYSLSLYQSWRWFEYLNSGDKEIDDECKGVRENVANYFGKYNYLVARGGSALGHEEPRQ